MTDDIKRAQILIAKDDISPQDREAQQERLAAMLRSIIENTSNPIYTLDRDYRYTGFNHAHVAMMNELYPGLDIQLGRSILDCIRDDIDRRQSKENLDRALAGEKLIRCYSQGNDSSTRRYFESIYNPIRTENGEVIGLSVFQTDITERQKAEDALKQSEMKYRGIFDESVATIYIFDQQGRFIDSNKAGLELLGYTWEDLLTMKYDDVIADQAQLLPIFEHLPSEKGLMNYEHRLKKKNGDIISVLSNSRPLINGDGEVIAILCTLIDITDRTRAEHALRESEAFIRAIMDNLPLGVAVNSLNPEVDFTYINDKFTKIYRTTKKAISEPDTFWEAVYQDPEFREKIKNRVIEDCSSGDPNCMSWDDVPLQRRGEETTYISARNIPVPDRQLMISTVWDVTGRKQMEKEKEILEAQLRHSQKMEAIGTLAGGISHDFNNLLQAINGYTQILLMEKEETDPDWTSLKAIQSAGYRAANLVRQLLLFSRKAEAERKPVDLNNVVEQAGRLLERIIPKMITIELTLGSRLKAINADPVQMEQILLNLAKNAADAMPSGGKLSIETQNIVLGEQYVQTHFDAEHGRYIQLMVSDTGHGIDSQSIEHIFEPFFTTKEIGHGTGLGLASVYGIVKSHNGHINCYSQVGQGTTFRIYLPAIEQEGLEDEPEYGSEEPTGGTESILIVDDEEPLRNFASRILRKYGYSILVASSGEDALEVFTEDPDRIDLVILDLGMPGMGGQQCLGRLLEISPDLKVLIASGYSMDDYVKKAMEAGALGFVSKPYQVNVLLNKVRRVLDGSN